MIETTPIPDLLVIRPRRLGDARGFFSEVWSRSRFAEAGLHHDWVQVKHSKSAEPMTLRGLHAQAPPAAQAKLVRCTAGAIWDVAVDMRLDSPTLGRWHAVELSADNWAQLLIPRGFLHGFLTLTPGAEVLYKVDAPYAPETDGGVTWDDPDLAIDWPLTGPPILSDKDRALPRLADWPNPFGERA